MKKKIYHSVGIALLLAIALQFLPACSTAASLFTLNGNNSPLATSDSCARLTNNGLNVFGSMWYKSKADLSQNFSIAATLYFGTNGAVGADGMTFSFQNRCTSAGATGADLGIGGVSPSLNVQFDTYVDNAFQGIDYGDPSYDFVAVHKNGDMNFHNAANTLVNPVPISVNNSVLFDQGQYWPVSIKWTAADTTLRVWLNHVLLVTYRGDIVKNIFGNDPYVYWGFTAGAGGLGNVQSVCMDTLPANAIKISNFSICQGQSRQVNLVGYNSYNWSPNTYISSTTVGNPVLNPPVSTTYYVSTTDACNNVQADSVRVTVNPLPTVSLTLPFIQKCQGEAALTLTGGTPAGGTYSGVAVSNGQFNPANAALGPQMIYYAYTNANGCTNSDSNGILINSPVSVSLNAFNSVCADIPAFALTGGSPSGGSYSGPGVSNGNFNPATAGVGSHTITYTYTDGNGCTGSATRTIAVSSIPSATIGNPASTVLCAGNSINLTTAAVNGVSYQWLQSSTPVTSLAAGNTSYSVTASGTYFLFASSQAGCNNTSAPVVITSGTVPSASITSGSTQFCPGASVTLSSSLSNNETIAWYSGNTVLSNQTAATYTATTAGAYKAVITSVSGCSATSNIITLSLLPGAVATATSSLPAFCPGTSAVTLSATTTSGAQYQWLNSNGAISGQTNPTYSATAAGSYSVVVSLSGCVDTSAVITLANAPNPDATLITADSTYCAGAGQVSVTATSGATYSWKLNGNTTAGNSNTLAVAQAGVYSVVVTSADQCSATSNVINMTEVAAPSASISTTGTAICSGNSVTLTAATVANATYEWKRNGNSLGAPSSASTYTANQSGSYVCVVNDGCSATSNAVTLTVSTAPGSAFSMTGDALVCPGGFDVYKVNAVSGATSYTWSVSPAGGAFIQGGQGTNEAVITFLNQNVTVSVVAINECGAGAPTTKAVDINTTPGCNGSSVAFGASPSNTCVGSTVTFYNYSDQSSLTGLNPVWDFGPGATPATSTSAGPVTVTYSTPGYKTVSLNYTDFGGNTVDGFGINDYVSISGTISTSAITGTTNLADCFANVETYSVVNTAGSTYNWTTTGGSIVSGQGSNSVSVNFASGGGTVAVTETNAAGCVGAPVTVTVSCPTGVNDLLSLDGSFSLYPNPTNGILTVDFSVSSNTTYQLQLFTIEGKEAMSIAGNINAAVIKQQLDLSAFAKGVYFLRLQAGSEVVSRKVVLQ